MITLVLVLLHSIENTSVVKQIGDANKKEKKQLGDVVFDVPLNSQN